MVVSVVTEIWAQHSVLIRTYYDFQLWIKDNSNSSYLDLDYGFTCPPNVDKGKYFTGKNPFSLDEVEVFEVNY